LGRFFRFRGIEVCITLLLTVVFGGCGSSNPTRTTFFPVPASVTLTPATAASLDLGAILTFTGTPHNAAGNPITTPITYQSSNAAVVTVALNGLACAGTWDSLSAPQVCTPGQVGSAQVTASARGVSSPPTTVFVHQHVTSIALNMVPNQVLGTCNLGLDPAKVPQLSKDQTFHLEATAFALVNGSLVDITSSVGIFTWQSQNSSVVQVSSSLSGPTPGQAQLSAVNPGITSVFASIANVNSVPIEVVTCPVQSISLAVTDEAGTDIIVPRGTGKSIVPTVIDTQGITITGVPLTWCSSQPAAVSTGTSNCATSAASTQSVTTSQVGGGTVTASCTPPNCNIGFTPSLPVYPQQAISFQVTPSSSGTAAAVTAFVSTTECGTTDSCVSEVVPLTAPGNTPGNPVSLPATPNSLVFDRQGQKAYLGTDSSLLGTKGVMILTPNATSSSVIQVKGVTGKVLTVSPDGKKVLIADSNQVFVLDTATDAATSLPIAGATAADFSPDNLEALIAAGGNLYVFSAVDPLKTFPFASLTDVSFLPLGAFAYLATSSGITPWTTCDNTQGSTFPVSTTGLIKALPPGDAINLFPAGVQPSINDVILAATNSGVTLIGAQTTPPSATPPAVPPPCPPTITTGPSQSFSFGQGTFTPLQLIVATNGQAAYIVPDSLSSILVFNLASGTPIPIGLTGTPRPLQASLSTDGSLLYVAATDGQVHVLNTQTLQDIQQISFPFLPSSLQNDLCAGNPTPCAPDLIAVKP